MRALAWRRACGSLHTPVLLSRSGVHSRALGQSLRLHPVLVIWGQFDEEVRPWEGMLAATYSDQDVDMDGRGYGVKYEHVAIPPSILLSFAPWRGARQHAELMQALPFTGGLGVLLRDHGVGEVRTGRDGEPIVRYRLSREDVEHMRRGVRGAARVVEAMGAQRIYSSHAKWVAYEPGRRGDLDSFSRDADACGWGAGQAQAVSFHIMGSARIGGSPGDSVCDPGGEVVEHAGPLCDGRFGLPDGLGGQPDGHDRGARAHECTGSGCQARLNSCSRGYARAP